MEQPLRRRLLTRIREDGVPATDRMCARLSPLGFDHIDFLGSYTFPTDSTTEAPRPLPDPDQGPVKVN